MSDRPPHPSNARNDRHGRDDRYQRNDRGGDRDERRGDRREGRRGDRRDGPRGGHEQRERSSNEIKIYGVNACRALFEKRPQALIRVYLHRRQMKVFSDVLQFCSRRALAYHLTEENEDLERITQSEHHEGICFLIRRPRFVTPREYLADPERYPTGCIVGLEGVGNPHNLGAIQRVAAHFGVTGLLTEEAAPLQTAAAIRTAEGGSEWVPIIEGGTIPLALEEFRRAGYRIVATSSHGGTSLYEVEFQPKTLFLFGHEGKGLDQHTFAAADDKIAIPGTGHVESLNVSCAAGIVLAEYTRQQMKPTA